MRFWYFVGAALMFFFLFDIPYMIYSIAIRRWRSTNIPAHRYIFYVSMMALEATYLMWVIPIVLREFS